VRDGEWMLSAADCEGQDGASIVDCATRDCFVDELELRPSYGQERNNSPRMICDHPYHCRDPHPQAWQPDSPNKFGGGE
jgi:hypothetical protein